MISKEVLLFNIIMMGFATVDIQEKIHIDINTIKNVNIKLLSK